MPASINVKLIDPVPDFMKEEGYIPLLNHLIYRRLICSSAERMPCQLRQAMRRAVRLGAFKNGKRRS